MRWRGSDHPFASSTASVTTETEPSRQPADRHLQQSGESQVQGVAPGREALGGHALNHRSLDTVDDKDWTSFKAKGGSERRETVVDPDALLDASCCSSSSSAQVYFTAPIRHSQLSSTHSSSSHGPLLPPHPDGNAEIASSLISRMEDNTKNPMSSSSSSSSSHTEPLLPSLSVDQDDDPGQDHACPEDPTSALSGAPPWKPQNQPSTCEFTHTILNYAQKRESGCKKAEYSATTVDNLGNRWRLIVYVNGNGRASNHHLSLFLQVADAEDLVFGWKKNVSYVLTLEHPNGASLGYTKRNPDKTFKLCPKAIDWGWSQFITSDRIQQEGFITNDSLTVRAHVTVKSSSIHIEPEDAELYLKCAVEEGKVHAVETCIAQGASVNCQFKDDLYTPLHTACSASASEVSLDVLNVLLLKGAHCNACNKWRETPLLIAANNGHTKAVAALLGKGADPTLCSEAGWSALTFAAHKGYDDIVSLLIAAGASVNCRVTEDLSTPLHKACAGSKPGHLNCVTQLLSAGADVHALNKWKETPLLTAANHGQAGTIGALLTAGADPCKCTDTGWSPLSIAAYKGHDEVVLLLLEKGAPTEEEDPTLSALLQAATKGLPSTVEILLRHGADHTVTTKKGDTALSILVEQNLIDTAVEMVTEYKASVPRCSRDRKKVQRARLLINLRVKQQQRECSLSLDSDDYSDQDDLDDDSNGALHDNGESPNSGPIGSKKKKKGLARTLFGKSIENAEAEAKAAAEALLLELEQEDAQAQKEEAAASTKRNKKKKKKERERLLKLEEDKLKKEKEQKEEEDRLRIRRVQEEKERKEREMKEQEQRENERLEEAERLAKAAQKKKEKEESERKLKKEQEKKERENVSRMERKAQESGNSKQSAPPEYVQSCIEKKPASISKSMSPYPDNISSPVSKQRNTVIEQPKQLLIPKSPSKPHSTLLPRNSKKMIDDLLDCNTRSSDSFIDHAEAPRKMAWLSASRESLQSIPLSPELKRNEQIFSIEYPAVSLFRREKVSELLNSYTKLSLSATSTKVNPLSLFDNYTIRSIINKWTIRASQSPFPSIDPLIPSWKDSEMLETFFQRQLISESQRGGHSRPSSISMEAAKEAGNALTKACIALATEVMGYAAKIEQHYSDDWSDKAFNMSAKDISLNGSTQSHIVIDWAGRSQVYLPLTTFNKLGNLFCGPASLFLACVFNLVTRYSTRRDIVLGTSLDYRLPGSTVDMLFRELNVTLELSSDPLCVQNDNKFFGLFHDIDLLFGGLPGFGGDPDDDNSRGLWNKSVSAAILTGSDSHTTSVHLRKVLNILEQSEGKSIPLSFAVFVVMDAFRDIEGTASAQDEFNIVRSWLTEKQLKYLRCFEMLPGGQHSYAFGDGDGHYDTSLHNSVFILLQNELGCERFSLRGDAVQNILATLIVPKTLLTKAIFNISLAKDKTSVETPPSLTPIPSSPTSSYSKGLSMDSFLSDTGSSLGLTQTSEPMNLNAVVTPMPSLSTIGSRRRERFFQLVDDGDDDVVADADSDAVSGMLRNLHNSSRLLREHDSSVYDVDIEAISLMGILPSSALGFDVEDNRNNSYDDHRGHGSSGTRKSNMNLR